jgi:hypothetical protein
MRHIIRTIALLIAVGIAVPAFAQVQTGSILVKTTDEQGAPTPGVAVTISSPVLVGQTTPVELAMKIAAVAETITVTGASPTVDTTSANVAVNLSEQLIQSTPGGRDIWALVEYKVPSLLITRPDVGGTSGGLQGTYTARGTTSGQNSQYLNGINVGDPSAIGAAGYYYDFDAFDDIQVSTGAHDITVPTGGVFLNMVTKSGGNTWQGRTTVAWEGSQTESQNIDANLLKYGFLPNTNSVDFVSDANFSAGGPLVANKLRLFGSVRDWRVHVNVPAAFSTNVLDQTNIDSVLLNLTYQLNQNNKITGFYSHQAYAKPNRFLNTPTTTLVQDSTSNEQDRFNVYQLLWNTIPTKNFFIDARLGYNTILFPTYVNSTAQSLTDNATSIITGAYTANTVRERPRLQGNATAQYYIDHALGGRHEFKFGFDATHAAGTVVTSRNGDVTTNWNSQTGLAQNVTLYATPFDTASTINNSALFIQDSYSVNRLTVTAGIRYEHLVGYLPAQSSPVSQWTTLGIPAFLNVPRTLAQTPVVSWNNTGPRVSGAFDLTGDGKTALKASAARYYYVLPTTGTPLDSVNPNATYQATYGWNDANHDLIFQPGEQTGTPVVTSGTTTSVDPGYRRPYTNEYAVGIDRDLGQALKLSVVYTYRSERYPTATINPTLPFATTLSSRADAGPDGVTGTADDTTIQYYNRLSATNLTVITNDPTSNQTYSGVEITATKRMSNRWQMLAGLTLAKTQIEGLSANITPNSLLNVSGPVTSATGLGTAQTGDHPYIFKMTGNYILPFRDIALAANLISESGIAYTRQVTGIPLTAGGTAAVNVEPLGSHRLDPRNQLDFRVSKDFKIGDKRSLEGAFDIYNVFNSNNIYDVRTGSGTLTFLQGGDPNGVKNVLPQFGSPASVLAPRIARFSLAFKF